MRASRSSGFKAAQAFSLSHSPLCPKVRAVWRMNSCTSGCALPYEWETSAAALGWALGGVNRVGAEADVEKQRRRYCIVGVGSRSGMYQEAIEKTYREHALLVGICDKNAGRLELARRQAKERGAEPPPA